MISLALGVFLSSKWYLSVENRGSIKGRNEAEQNICHESTI